MTKKYDIDKQLKPEHIIHKLYEINKEIENYVLKKHDLDDPKNIEHLKEIKYEIRNIIGKEED